MSSDIKEGKPRMWLWSNGVYPDNIKSDPETYSESTDNSETKSWLSDPISELKKKSEIPSSLKYVLKLVNTNHDNQSISEMIYCNDDLPCVTCDNV